jgi:hypothetical protein
MRVIPVLRFDAVFRHDLHVHAFEINGHPPLQLICAHLQDREALLEIDGGMVVLVEDGEAVVPSIIAY